MEKTPTFFDFAAEAGLTKHFGGAAATQELASLCHIGADSYVLDVGCGAGTTAAFLARQYGCRVVGVDIRPRMIERARETAQRAGVLDRLEFRVADVQDLPFDDNLFDAVLSESVTAFPADKAKAVREYARVTKPGGYVGLGEATWLKLPPPPELLAWVRQDVGAAVLPLAADEWVALLQGAGLSEIVSQMRTVQVADEAKGLAQRYGRAGMLRVSLRMLSLYVRSPAYRAFVKSVRQGGVVPSGLNEYFGYGMYVGRK
jgi:ubiquinone/menaquinone biosynthesis C-methylase UbiE